jgi:hypothetical protein
VTPAKIRVSCVVVILLVLKFKLIWCPGGIWTGGSKVGLLKLEHYLRIEPLIYNLRPSANLLFLHRATSHFISSSICTYKCQWQLTEAYEPIKCELSLPAVRYTASGLAQWTISPRSLKDTPCLSSFLQPPLGNEVVILSHTSYPQKSSHLYHDCISALPYLSFTEESCGSFFSQ